MEMKKIFFIAIPLFYVVCNSYAKTAVVSTATLQASTTTQTQIIKNGDKKVIGKVVVVRKVTK